MKSNTATASLPHSSKSMDGILLVDKPPGPTSHDVVAMIRRKFALPKVGHGGTLDPDATGLLLVLVGRGTKRSDLFISSDKIYEGTISLGVATDSFDARGKTISEKDASGITREQLQDEMNKYTGDILQTPPMVSAVKMNGVPLYKRARKGETVERRPRLIHVFEFSLTGFSSPDGDFIVRCTKGTYVRALCNDIGDSLGCGAHLKSLRRTQCGDMSIKDAIPLNELLEMEKDSLSERVLPVRRFAGLPGVKV